MRNTEADFQFKIVVVGDTSVGKSCLIRRFGFDEFSDDLSSTIGVDFIVKNVLVDGFTARLQIWDTAGQERFRTIITGYYRGADSVIFVFDKTKRESFDHIDQWVFEVSQYDTEKAVKVLVGNKSDMESVVFNQEAQEKAENFGYQYFTASAKNDLNIKNIFYSITRALVQKNKEIGVVPIIGNNDRTALGNVRNKSSSPCCVIA